MSPVTAEAKILSDLCTATVLITPVLTIMLFTCVHGNMAASSKQERQKKETLS